MDTDLIGLTREHAMRMAADLTISGSAEHVIELLQRAQRNALIAVLGVAETERILSGQYRLAA